MPRIKLYPKSIALRDPRGVESLQQASKSLPAAFEWSWRHRVERCSALFWLLEFQLWQLQLWLVQSLSSSPLPSLFLLQLQSSSYTLTLFHRWPSRRGSLELYESSCEKLLRFYRSKKPVRDRERLRRQLECPTIRFEKWLRKEFYERALTVASDNARTMNVESLMRFIYFLSLFHNRKLEKDWGLRINRRLAIKSIQLNSLITLFRFHFHYHYIAFENCINDVTANDFRRFRRTRLNFRRPINHRISDLFWKASISRPSQSRRSSWKSSNLLHNFCLSLTHSQIYLLYQSSPVACQ